MSNSTQKLLARVSEAMKTMGCIDAPRSEWWDLVADSAIAEISRAFRDAELGLSADWLDQQRKAAPPPLWRLMESAFDSVVDDCFYEFNFAAEAMLRVVAARLAEQGFAEAAAHLRDEALRAAKYEALTAD